MNLPPNAKFANLLREHKTKLWVERGDRQRRVSGVSEYVETVVTLNCTMPCSCVTLALQGTITVELREKQVFRCLTIRL